MKKLINSMALILSLALAMTLKAGAFQTTYDIGTGEMYFDSGQGFVGQSFDMGSSTMYHNYDSGFSGSSWDMGGSTLYLETSPGSLYWIRD